MGKKREYDDDDGRTIADMSGLYGDMPRKNRENQKSWESEKSRQEDGITKSERRYYILGAMKAGLLIALAFIVGLGLTVGLLLLLWT